jgi:hypothetical protein
VRAAGDGVGYDLLELIGVKPFMIVAAAACSLQL